MDNFSGNHIKNDELSCQVCVIGSGAGGASVASTLAEKGLDVIILEEGDFLDTEKSPLTAPSSMVNMWRSAGLTPALGKSPIAYAEGNCVGGGTEINSAIFQRVPEEIEHYWAKEIPDLDTGELAPYYDWAGDVVNASTTDGELGPASDLLKKASQKQQWNYTVLERGQRSCVGTNHCSFGCPTGGKQSMVRTLIPKAVSNNARIFSNVHVKKIVSNGNKAQFALCDVKSKNKTRKSIKVFADAFFVACGAIHSPALLQRSGLKSAASSSFQLHPTLKIMGLFNRKIDASSSRLPLFAITEFMPKFRIGGSVTTPGTFGMNLAENLESRSHLIAEMDQTATYYSMIAPEGWGSIRHVWPFKDPFVSYSLTQKDYETLDYSIKQLGKALFDVGASTLFPSMQNHNGWGSFDEMDEDRLIPKCMNLMSIHLFSSASPLRKNAENDSFGKINAVSNVYITDASLVPSAPCVNPQATIMALAKRSADHFFTLKA